jgi:hypothetical protein
METNNDTENNLLKLWIQGKIKNNVIIRKKPKSLFEK